MRTLTPGAQAAKEARSATFDLLIESTSLDFHYSLSTTTAGGHTWEQRLRYESFNDVVYNVQPGGGLGSATTFQCELAEDYQGQSIGALFQAGLAIAGADLTFSWLFDGEAYADKIILFTGTIRDYHIAGTTSRLIASDDTIPANKTIPPTTVAISDYPSAGRDALGKRIPVLYGRFNLDPSPLLLTDTTNGTYTIASHPLESIDPLVRLGVFRAEARNLVEIREAVVRDAPGARVILLQPISTIFFGTSLGPGAIAIPPKVVTRQLDVLNAGDILDPSPTTWAEINTDTNLIDNDGYGYLGVAAQLVGVGFEGKDTVHLTITHGGNPSAAATLVSRMTINHLETDQTTVVRNIATLENLRWYSSRRQTELEYANVSLGVDEWLEVYIEARNEGGLGTSVDDWQGVFIEFDYGTYAKSENEVLYLRQGMQGRPDDLNGTYTGDPTSTIHNMSDVLRSILLQDLEVPQIDTASFDAARAFYDVWSLDLDGGIGTGWYQESEEGRSWLNRLLIMATAILFQTGSGYKLVPFDATTPSRYTFTIDTILFPSGANPPLENQRPTFRLNRDASTPIVHIVELHARYRPEFQEFDTYERTDEIASSLTPGITPATAEELRARCADSLAKHGPQPPMETFVDYGETRTAEYLMAHQVRYFAGRREFVTFETGTQGLHLELGDFILINYPDLPMGLQSVKFEIHRLIYRFVAVTAPDGGRALSFRIEITASFQTVNKTFAPVFDEDIFDDSTFATSIC